MAIRNIKLTICYDGFDYSGWQTQPGKKTIQQTLNEAIGNLLGCKINVTGASRTDAGVSALGQVALFQIDSPIPTENLARAITDRLPPDIAVTEAVEVPAGFDVIGLVKNKLYRYAICTSPVRPVLRIRHCWHLPAELNTDAMAEAAKILVGKKDFKSFVSAADNRENSVRTIFRCGVVAENDWMHVDIEGDGFLYNMVRNIVGTLAEVGLGRLTPERIKQIIEAKDRTAAGPIAPAAGLCLMWIKY
jgi:tRNA pseudouridine38-40 synthase